MDYMGFRKEVSIDQPCLVFNVQTHIELMRRHRYNDKYFMKTCWFWIFGNSVACEPVESPEPVATPLLLLIEEIGEEM